MKNEPRFQIVVPAFNEEKSLEHVLRHAMVCGYLKHLIIVDDASTDSTPLILEKWGRDFGLRAIRLQRNCKKEGAIRVVMEALRDAGELKPYTLLLDSDSMLVGDSSGNSLFSQIERCIDQMQQDGYQALALRIDAVLSNKPRLFELCAFADYTAMQFDQWIVGLQGQLWVINGPGGIFETRQLLSILQDMVPDFETGDLLITVKLMIRSQLIGFCPSICVETFVPGDLQSYFKQRRRWERGTTKVLWNEMPFYLGLFARFRLLGLSTVIHLSMYLGLTAALALIFVGRMQWSNFYTVLFSSAALWFLVSIIKGVFIKLTRPRLRFWRYCGCAVLNSGLWMLVTTPARLVGFAEGVSQILSGVNSPALYPCEVVQHVWLGTTRGMGGSSSVLEECDS